MRTIKFRGYSKDFTENEWFFGNLIDKGNGSFQILEKNPKIWDLSYDGITVIPESIGQFTEFHDKNGKEIYEGEILYNNDRKEHCIVKYSKEKAMFIVKYLESKDEFPLWVSISNLYYSVGNTYENPELLEKKFAN